MWYKLKGHIKLVSFKNIDICRMYVLITIIFGAHNNIGPNMGTSEQLGSTTPQKFGRVS